MDNIKIKLVDGIYDTDDSKEILVELLTHKIEFHRRKQFSSYLKYGHEKTDSLKRIQELTDARNALLNYLKNAEMQKSKVRIEAVINMNTEK